MIIFRCFLRASCGETPVRSAPRGIQGTRRHEAVLRQTREHQLDQFPVVRADQLRSHAQHKIHRGVHRHQIEIEVTGRLRRIPTFRAGPRFRIFEVHRVEIVRPHQCHPIERSRPHHRKVFALGPEKSGAEWSQQPLVSGGHNKVGPQLLHIHGQRAAGLAGIQQKQRSLFVARVRNARGIEQRSVVVAHHAHGDQSRPWSHRGDQIIRGDEPVARRNNFQLQPLAFLHRFPCRELQRELALCRDDFVARLPRQRVRDCRYARACSAGQRNLFRFAAYQLCDGRASAVRHFKKSGIRFVMRIFLRFERRLHGANGNLRHRRLARQIQIGRVLNFEPLLPPVGLR